MYHIYHMLTICTIRHAQRMFQRASVTIYATHSQFFQTPEEPVTYEKKGVCYSEVMKQGFIKHLQTSLDVKEL